MGRGDSATADDILYGTLIAGAHRSETFTLHNIGLSRELINPNCLELKVLGHFQRVEGYCGSNNWNVRVPELPSEWLEGSPKVYETPASDLNLFLLALNSPSRSKQLEEAELCQLSERPDDIQERIMVTMNDSSGNKHLVSTHQMAAIEYLIGDSQGQWKILQRALDPEEQSFEKIMVYVAHGRALGSIRI